MPRATVLLADDHAVVVEGLASLLRTEFTVVGTVTDGTQLLEAARQFQPDVIVTDLSMPGGSGLDALRRLKGDGLAPTAAKGASAPQAPRVIVLTMHADVDLAAEALRAGASGFILKDAAGTELVAAIRAALQGKIYLTPELAQDVLATLAEPGASRKQKLTPRQREVVRLLADGRTMREVAVTLGLSPRTVETHKYQIMEALGLTTTAQLIRYAIEHGLATPPARE
jgi:DNA-binding NarL/FixJ family response regulator